MAASLNKVELLGVLAAEPFTKQSAAGEQLCCFSLRVEIETLNARNDLVKEVCIVDVEAPGALGQLVMNYFHKDSPVFVDGRLRMEYVMDNRSGRRISRHVVTAQVIQSAVPDNAPVPEPPVADNEEPPLNFDEAHPIDGASEMSF